MVTLLPPGTLALQVEVMLEVIAVEVESVVEAVNETPTVPLTVATSTVDVILKLAAKAPTDVRIIDMSLFGTWPSSRLSNTNCHTLLHTARRLT